MNGNALSQSVSHPDTSTNALNCGACALQPLQCGNHGGRTAFASTVRVRGRVGVYQPPCRNSVVADFLRIRLRRVYFATSLCRSFFRLRIQDGITIDRARCQRGAKTRAARALHPRYLSGWRRLQRTRRPPEWCQRMPPSATYVRSAARLAAGRSSVHAHNRLLVYILFICWYSPTTSFAAR